jgi:hypothetical protein
MLTVQRLPEAREGLGGRLSHYTLYKPVFGPAHGVHFTVPGGDYP